jgi:diguanylate cyclase (GGDEF)-like protein
MNSVLTALETLALWQSGNIKRTKGVHGQNRLTTPFHAGAYRRADFRLLNANPCPIGVNCTTWGRFQDGWKIRMNEPDPDEERPTRKMERRRSGASPRALYRPALVASCMGIVLSFVGAFAVSQWENRVARAEFEGLAETQAIVVQNGVNEYLSRLMTLRTLFESANEDITRSEYESFTSRLFEGHSGILRVVWIPKIRRKERAEYEAAAAADGVSGYRIKTFADGGLAPGSDEYYPVYFSTEPKTSALYGLDYWTDPDRRAALERARDDDEVTVLRTKRFEASSGPNAIGVAVGVPIYAKGTSRTTIADRRRNLSGFVVGIFDLRQLLQSIRAKAAANPAVSLSVYPPSSEAASAKPESWGPPDFTSEARMRPSGSVLWSTMLRIGDTNWRLVAAPAIGGPLIAQHYRALVLFAATLLVTLFLAIYLAQASRNSLQLKLANRRVLELAQTDILTGLPNRAFFLEQLHEINACERVCFRFSILMLDLDRFKNVNDSLGHAAGDALLRQVAQRLSSALQNSDVLARLGGDEFAIIQSACDNQRTGSIELAIRISKLIAQPFELPGHQVEIGTSIGIALCPEHGEDLEQLLKKADLALYRSKGAGRNCHTVYDDVMSAELEARNTLEGDLREAIARCQFEVHYQSFYDVQSGARRGLEALVRWRHPTRGLVPPDQFIPLAEETGLIVPLGEWVLRQACDDATWLPADLKVAVNLSAVQFKQAELFDVIQSALRSSGLAADRLEIEITESVLLERAVENHAFIAKLKSIGISLALDDFGTGYSSLGYLTTFPFDKIKIDKSFIRNLTKRPESTAIIASIMTLARGLDILVTAEGVETAEQFDRLKALGMNFAQGYLLGRPVPIGDLEAQPELYQSQALQEVAA